MENWINDNRRNIGDITREIISQKEIKGPSIEGKVEVRKGLWVVPKPGQSIDELKAKYSGGIIAN